MFRTNQHDTPEATTRATRNAVDQRQSSHPDISHPLTEGSTPDPKDAAVSEVQIPPVPSPGDPCGLGGRGPTDGSAGLARGAFGVATGSRTASCSRRITCTFRGQCRSTATVW